MCFFQVTSISICQIKNYHTIPYHTISTKNSDLDLKRQTRKIYANTNLLLRKFSKCSVDVKCYLFKAYCSNLYCAPMWFDCTKTALKK